MSDKRVPTYSWRYWVILLASNTMALTYAHLDGYWRLVPAFIWGLVLAMCWTGERTALERSRKSIRNSSTERES